MLVWRFCYPDASLSVQVSGALPSNGGLSQRLIAQIRNEPVACATTRWVEDPSSMQRSSIMWCSQHRVRRSDRA